jgi:hypothetical protein
VLGFSDIGLAYLAIAASAVEPSRRSRWLKQLALELEGHPPTPNARRVRRHRARTRNGQRVYRIVMDQVDLEELLLASRTLAPNARDDHAAVERALERLLSILIADHPGNAFPPGREIYDIRVGLCLSALRREVSGGPSKLR